MICSNGMTTAQILVYSAAVVTGLFNTWLAITVFRQNPTHRTNQLLTAYIIIYNLFLQTVSIIIVSAESNYAVALLGFRLAFFLGLAAPIYYLFVQSYLGTQHRNLLSWMILPYAITVIITPLFAYQGIINLVWRPTASYFILKPTWSIYLGIGLNIAYYWAASRALLTHRETEPIPMERNRLIYLAIAPIFTVIGILLSTTPALYYLPWDIFGTTLTMALIAYAVLRYELLDVHVVVKETLIYSTIVGGVMTTLAVLAYITSATSNVQSFNFITLPTLFMVLVTATLIYIIYQRKEQLIRLLQEERELRNTNEELITVASHNLRTPLTSIRGNLQLLVEDKTQTPTNIKSIQNMVLATNKLGLLIESMLALSHISEQNPNTTEKIDLAKATNQIISDYTESFQIKGVKHVFTHPTKRTYAHGETNLIKTAIANLVDNALQYTKKGSVTILIEEESNLIKLSVTDTGIGIKPHEQNLLFKKFSRLESSTSGGAGLGLYTTKLIIETFGGQLGVESEFGTGSTFWFTLPKA